MSEQPEKIPLGDPRLIGKVLGEIIRPWNADDVIRYARSVTFEPPEEFDPAAQFSELSFVYERYGPIVPPSFAAILSAGPDGLREIDYVRETMVHRRHRLTVHQRIPAAGELKVQSVLKAVYDQGPGKDAIFVIENTGRRTDDGAPVFEMQATLNVTGHGGYGGEAPPPSRGAINVPPEESDYAAEIVTTRGQAADYRMATEFSDRMIAHIDPRIAAKQPYKKPLLHGLCTFAAAGKHLLKFCCGWDPSRFVTQSVAFTGFVFPGDTLVIQIKKTGLGTADYNVFNGSKLVLAGDFEYIPEAV